MNVNELIRLILAMVAVVTAFEFGRKTGKGLAS